LELLVHRLQLLVRRLELLVRRLQLLVRRLELLVRRLQLLDRRLELLVRGLELTPCPLELLLEPPLPRHLAAPAPHPPDLLARAVPRGDLDVECPLVADARVPADVPARDTPLRGTNLVEERPQLERPVRDLEVLERPADVPQLEAEQTAGDLVDGDDAVL